MSPLVLEAEKFIFDLFSEQLHSNYVYHNLAHTQRVVEKVQEIIAHVQVSAKDEEHLLLAAWFHDAGYTVRAQNHEEESVQIARNFLESKKYDAQRIEKVGSIILATKLGTSPKNLLEEIIADADCAHLAEKSFFDYSSLLRKEWELCSGKKITEEEWILSNLTFFTETHSFYSDYALKNWSKVKEKNLAKLLKNQKKLKEVQDKFNQKKEAIELKKSKIAAPERGIETMFRVALRNHITLSDIADTKANILLSVNAIIISMSFSTLIPKLDNPSNGYLILPSVIFILFTVACMILSILATRPNVTQGKFTKEDVANKKVNLLFFGNFHQMKLDEFEWGMSEMMQDRDYLYGSLTKDLYFLGLVLNRKYGILRTTYTVFMIGIIVSVVAFTIAFMSQDASLVTQ